MLAAVITAKDAEDVIKDAEKAKNADLVELRLDYIKNLDGENLKRIIKNCKKPVITTNRRKSEGGFFIWGENKRIEILKKAVNSGVDYVDIEYSSDKDSIKNLIKIKNKTKIIISYHNFEETPDDITNIYNYIKKLNPDLIKITTYANSVTDNFRIFDLIKMANRENKKVIAFCMGSYGQFSRILSVILGSQITYASVEKGKESASGQLAVNELVSCYRIKKLNKNTKIAGLIGNPVGHSWSHIIHNSAFEKFGINAVYLKFQVDKLKEFVWYFRRFDLMGFSVTIPHKIEVIKYLDSIDKKAKKIGAVNTIVAKNGKLIGYNTDCGGAMQALKSKTKIRNRNVVLLGAGGSARALAYGLKEEGANITILNRTINKAALLADYFNCNYGPLGALKNIDYDVLINTTSAGMHPEINNSPVNAGLIKKNSVVFDIVFNPFKTRLLLDAEKKGCGIIPGIEMLIYGNMMQFKLWTGKNAPEQLIRNKVSGYLKNADN